MANENALILRAQSGDDQAFTDLVKDYHAFVYAIVDDLLDDRRDVEEVVQDVFINAYRGLVQLEDTAKFKGWLAEIARNCARDRMRKKGLETVPIDDVGSVALETFDSVDERLIRDEQIELIRRAINSLSQKDRDIARAYYLEGASYDELIRAHGLSYKAISFRLSRAKRTLSKRLKHLLSGVFISPGAALKKFHSGGLATMKVGTAPKITIGILALISLIGVVYVGSRQLIAPEKSASLTAKVPVSQDEASEQSSAAVNSSLGEKVAASSPKVEPQLSAEEMEQVEDFFAQLEADDAQSDDTLSSEDDERDEIAAQAFDIDDGQSPEDVMNAYLEAYRNADFEALLPLVTGAAREGVESVLQILGGELPAGFLDGMADHMPEGISEELAADALQIVQESIDTLEVREMARESMRKMYSGVEILSSGYAGNEFHFQLRIPTVGPSEMLDMFDMPEMPDFELPEMPELPEHVDTVHKMRKEDGKWLVYE